MVFFFQNGDQKNKNKTKQKKQKTNFRLTKKVMRPKFEKHFPKENFNTIWLKVEKYECIYIFEIKFESILSNMAAITSFTILRNNANLC